MKKYFFLAIVLLASILRLWNLGSVPPSLHADEVDTGYTAYSILKTGKDHYSDSLTPFFFRGQSAVYRAPVYTYLVIPSVAVLGLNPFAVRLPSAILGIGFVVCIYYLSKKLFQNENIAFVSMFLAAINPWSIHVSRTGLEVGSAVFFITLGAVLFLYGFQSKKLQYFIYLSAFSFSASIFTYHSAKIFTPIVIFLLCGFVYKKHILRNRVILIVFIIFSFFYSLMLYQNVLKKGGAEYYNVSIFNSSRAQQVVDRERTITNASLQVSSIFHNKVLYYIKNFQYHFIEPLSVNFLFLNGENSLDKGVSNHGQYYLFELPFFFIGWYLVLKKSRKTFLFLLSWFLLALIPGAITTNGYYAYRDIQLLPIPLLVTGYGLGSVFEKIKKRNSKILFSCMLVLIVLVSLISYLFIYFFDYPAYSRNWWGYNQWDAVKYAVDNQAKYEQIYIHGGEDWPVIYSFYNKIDPNIFRNAFMNQSMDNGKKQMRIGKYYFGDIIGINHEEINPDIKKNSLLIVPGDVYTNFTPVRTFRDVDGVHVTLNAFEVR